MNNSRSHTDKGIDHTVFLQIASGDQRAFTALFDHYYDLFYGRAFVLSGSHYFSEELVQEVFVNIWKQRQHVAHADNPDGYLFRMFYREFHRRLREDAIQKKLHDATLEMPASEELTAEDIDALDRRITIVRKALEEMPPQRAMVFKLIKEEGMSRAEVAEQLHISQNTVRNHLAAAISQLRKIARTIKLWGWFG